MMYFVAFDGQSVQTNDVDVKRFVETKLRLQPSHYHLTCGGKPITRASEIPAGGTVEVNLRLAGGKVHGSLARAGKVKNQTPKVEAEEDKPKKLTGRAKRREQYNRRFVNVVVTVGRKKGPNARPQPGTK